MWVNLLALSAFRICMLLKKRALLLPLLLIIVYVNVRIIRKFSVNKSVQCHTYLCSLIVSIWMAPFTLTITLIDPYIINAQCFIRKDSVCQIIVLFWKSLKFEYYLLTIYSKLIFLSLKVENIKINKSKQK